MSCPPPAGHRRKYGRRPCAAIGGGRRGAERGYAKLLRELCRAPSSILPSRRRRRQPAGRDGPRRLRRRRHHRLGAQRLHRRAPDRTPDRAGAHRARSGHADVRELLGPAGALRSRPAAASANPKGREIGFARRIRLTRTVALIRCMRVRTRSSTPSPCIWTRSRHSRPACRCWRQRRLAGTGRRVRSYGAVAWGVQYHPEYSLGDMAAIVRRSASAWSRTRFSPMRPTCSTYARELDALYCDPANKALSWRLGLDARCSTLRARKRDRNWIITACCRCAARGRG